MSRREYPVSLKQQQRILELSEAGLTPYNIATELGLSKRQAQWVLNHKRTNTGAAVRKQEAL